MAKSKALKKEKPKKLRPKKSKTKSKAAKPAKARARSAKALPFDELLDNQWPLKRQVLFRPERLTYIEGQKSRKTDDAGGSLCVFCEALRQGVSFNSLLLFETPFAMVVMNKYPYNPGHVMVLPKRHEGDFLALSLEELGEISRLTQKTVAILKSAYGTQDFNIGINLGRGAGAGIPQHIHVHIVPRWSGDTNFFPLIAQTKVLPTDNQSIFEKLAPLFESAGRKGI